MATWKMEGVGALGLRDLGDSIGVADGVTVIVSDRVMGRLANANPTLALGFSREPKPSDCADVDLTAGQVALAVMLGQTVLIDGSIVSKVTLDAGAPAFGLDPLVNVYNDAGNFDSYATTETVPGARRVVVETV